MKRLISILVITAMLLASVMAMIPAFADEIETPKAPTEYTNNIKWSDLTMVSKDEDGKDKTDFTTLFNVSTGEDGTELITTANNGAAQRSYYSSTMYKITETTYYEYTVSATNYRKGGYAGVVFAYGKNLPYIMYGSFDNWEDDNGTNPWSGDSKIVITHGNKGEEVSDNAYPRLALEDDYGTVKVVYDGYDVSVYALTAEGWKHCAANDFTLPKDDAYVCVGILNREGTGDGQRTMSLRNASITAKGREAAAILAGASEAKVALAVALDKAYGISIFTDYTDASVEVFNTAIANAEAIFTDATKTDEDFADAKEAIETALVGKKADLTALIDL